MPVSGFWIDHFSWGGCNSYGQFKFNFDPNGTFGGTFPEKWVQQDGAVPEKHGAKAIIDSRLGKQTPIIPTISLRVGS